MHAGLPLSHSPYVACPLTKKLPKGSFCLVNENRRFREESAGVALIKGNQDTVFFGNLLDCLLFAADAEKRSVNPVTVITQSVGYGGMSDPPQSFLYLHQERILRSW